MKRTAQVYEIFGLVFQQVIPQPNRKPEGVEELSRFASRVGELLVPEGIWHSLVGSTDGPPRDTGPPRQSATDLVSALEQYFELLELRATQFDQENHKHAMAWVLVARRRTFYPD